MKRMAKIHDKTRSSFLYSFIYKYGLLLIFMIFLCFIGIFSLYKYTLAKQTYVYVKVKVSQGMWWANTQRPNIWLVRAIQDANESKDIVGREIAQIVNVAYYPYNYPPTSIQYSSSGQFEIYVTAKIKISLLGKKNVYSFNREMIGVGSPIAFEFPNVQFTGTIISLSKDLLNEKYTEKYVYLSKRVPLPWEYDQIQIGDWQSDGSQKVFEIVSKEYTDELNTAFLQQGTLISDTSRLFVVKAKMLVKVIDNQYVFGEEYIIAPGKYLNSLTTQKFTFNDYNIVKVE